MGLFGRVGRERVCPRVRARWNAFIVLGALTAFSACGPRIDEEAVRVSPVSIRALVDPVQEGNRLCLVENDLYIIWSGLEGTEKLPAVFLSKVPTGADSQAETIRLSAQGVGGLAPVIWSQESGVGAAWLERQNRGRNAEYFIRFGRYAGGGFEANESSDSSFGTERHPLRYREVAGRHYVVGVSKVPGQKAWKQRLFRQEGSTWSEVSLPGADESDPWPAEVQSLGEKVIAMWLSGGELRGAVLKNETTWEPVSSPASSKAESFTLFSVSGESFGLIWAESEGMRTTLKLSWCQVGTDEWGAPEALQVLQGSGVDFLGVSEVSGDQMEVLLQFRETTSGCKSLNWLPISRSGGGTLTKITGELCRASHNAVAVVSYNGAMAAWPHSPEGGDENGIQLGTRGSKVGEWDVSPSLLLKSPDEKIYEAPVIMLEGRNAYLAYCGSEKKAGIAGMFGRSDDRALYVKKLYRMIPYSPF